MSQRPGVVAARGRWRSWPWRHSATDRMWVRRGAPSEATAPESSPCVEESARGLRVPHDPIRSRTPLIEVPLADRRRVRLLWWRRVPAPDPSEPGLFFFTQRSTALSYRPEHRPPAFPLPISWHAAPPSRGDPLALQTRRTATRAPGQARVPAPSTLSARHVRPLPPRRRVAPLIQRWHCWFILLNWGPSICCPPNTPRSPPFPACVP